MAASILARRDAALLHAAVLATALSGSSAHARGPEPASPVRLRWSAPEGCPDVRAVQRQIDARLHGGGRPVEASGTVTSQGDDAWVLQLHVRTAQGRDERELQATSCASLADAASLLVAIAADPSVAAQPLSPDDPPLTESSDPPADPGDTLVPRPPADPAPIEAAPAKPDPPKPPVPEPPAAITKPTADPKPPARVRGLARVDGIAQLLRVLPRTVSGAIGGAVGLTLPHARVEARGRYAFAQRTSYPSRPEVGGHIDLWTASVHGCWAPSVGPIEIPVCAGVEIGRMRASSFGVTDDDVGRSVWVALPVDASVVWAPLPWLALRVGPEVAAVLRRPRFHVRELPTLFRAAPATVRLVGGLEARFP